MQSIFNAWVILFLLEPCIQDMEILCVIAVHLLVCNEFFPYCMAGKICIDVCALVVQQLLNKLYI